MYYGWSLPPTYILLCIDNADIWKSPFGIFMYCRHLRISDVDISLREFHVPQLTSDSNNTHLHFTSADIWLSLWGSAPQLKCFPWHIPTWCQSAVIWVFLNEEVRLTWSLPPTTHTSTTHTSLFLKCRHLPVSLRKCTSADLCFQDDTPLCFQKAVIWQSPWRSVPWLTSAQSNNTYLNNIYPSVFELQMYDGLLEGACLNKTHGPDQRSVTLSYWHLIGSSQFRAKSKCCV